MSKALDEFKEFVRTYPKLKHDVRDGKRSWQSIYEEWVLLGDDGSWDEFKEDAEPQPVDAKESKASSSIDSSELLKSALSYVKKLNPDDITKTLSSVQKVVGIFQGLSSGSGDNKQKVNFTPKRRVDPLFRRYDDYDYYDGE
ncbi:spore coat protein YlbD [Haloplasma contractile]|uniref:Cytoplasmic protein n=1 Tax=Haloplasma contractile SSD-17B TaxID=1033810 RepID=U2DZ31_9MOLU|nr:spore coat protein YlbD [Haloplasma contractile]ERJ13487.1 cytoplasmic protein [Haloplasma contractile SSD-17B]